MRSILVMIRKEFRQIFRTREMVGILFIMPAIQMVVLGFAVTNEVKHVTLLVADLDDSRISRRLVEGFSHTDRFDIVGHRGDREGIAEALQAWEAQVAVIIPEDFGRDVQRGLQPELQVIADGVDGNAAGVALGYIRGIVATLAADQLASRPAARTDLRGVRQAAVAERIWYNSNLDSAQYMVPGIVVVLLTVISLMLSAMSLVREGEIGTLEQLMVTPLRKHELLLGKLTPFLILGFIELAIVLRLAQFIFGIEMQGSYLALGVYSFLYLFTTLGLGIFVSTITRSQQQALFVAWFFMVLMIMMSGLFIPIENMPAALQKITYLNPMRYFMYIIRDLFQKGAGAVYLLRDALPMAGFGIAIFIFSTLRFRKRVG